MIINNLHYVIFHITVQVFHQYYYDEVTQVKCSLSSERWRFESIINQLVITPKKQIFDKTLVIKLLQKLH
jgi:hypothetical protein